MIVSLVNEPTEAMDFYLRNQYISSKIRNPTEPTQTMDSKLETSLLPIHLLVHGYNHYCSTTITILN